MNKNTDKERDPIKIKSIKKIIKIFNKSKKIPAHKCYKPSNNHNKYYFRGHSDCNYDLEPAIARTSKNIKHEHIYIQESIRRNPEEYQQNYLTHLDYLKKMQHYGIHTRLLDISESLLTALYFAVQENKDDRDKETDGELIIFNVDKKSVNYTISDKVTMGAAIAFLPIEKKNKIYSNILDKYYSPENRDESRNGVFDFLIHQIKREKSYFEDRIDSNDLLKYLFVDPIRDNRRIAQQTGSFIICPVSFSLDKDKSYNSTNGVVIDCLDNYRLRDAKGNMLRFIIPAEAKENIREELKLMGVNYSTMFPEIESTAKYLKDEYM